MLIFKMFILFLLLFFISTVLKVYYVLRSVFWKEFCVAGRKATGMQNMFPAIWFLFWCSSLASWSNSWFINEISRRIMNFIYTPCNSDSMLEILCIFPLIYRAWALLFVEMRGFVLDAIQVLCTKRFPYSFFQNCTGLNRGMTCRPCTGWPKT